MKVLVTGATGNVGGRVVERLLAQGVRPRVFMRDPDKARARFGDRVEVAIGDLADARSLGDALSGVGRLFLVNSGPGLEVRDAAAAEVAKRAGVEVLVKLSSMDVEQQVGTGLWHARGEAAIRASGIGFTFVEPSGFMDNALFWSRSIEAEGLVRSSTGDGCIGFIHSDDIADVATKALTTRDYLGESLPLSGPDALSYAEMAAKIGRAIGKTIAYELISDEQAGRALAAVGENQAMVEAHLSIFRAIREGRLASVTRNVERVLGRPAISFDRWVEENLGAFSARAAHG